jgi:saccharopine dehydrogenase (NAD+, L-lysine-forming)
MYKTLVIGCGGVAQVVIRKMAMHPEIFPEILIASRTVSKVDALIADIGDVGVSFGSAQVDADNTFELVALMKSFEPFLCVNVALPYQDLAIMDACLECGVHYLDTANYEPRDEAHFEYSWQWAYRERFEKAGLCAVLGCGFDPGVTGVFSAYALKHYFDTIEYIDILDCNGGDHG